MSSSPAKDPPSRSASVVVNRLSGSGDVGLDDLVAAMEEGGVRVVSAETAEKPEDFPDLVRRAGEQADIVVIGGGDGTISRTMPLILEMGRTLGILPLGTANDLARSLDIPFDPCEAARIIGTGTVRRIDLGEINGRPFCNAISLGFPVEVAAYHDRDWKKYLGVFAYPVAWIQAAARFRPFDVTIQCDDEDIELTSLFTLTVMNGRYHGGGLSVDENSEIDDGILKAYAVKDVSGWRLVWTFLSLKLGRLHRDTYTRLFRAKGIEIRGKRRRRINVDGDILEKTPAKILVRPGAVGVVVPAGSATAGLASPTET